MGKNTDQLSQEQHEGMIKALKTRFDQNMGRHMTLKWPDILQKLEASPTKLWSLHQMESTGGEPDVVGQDRATGEFIFYDCSAESPQERRNLCYDRKALEARKSNKPPNSAIEMAKAMGIEVLTEEEYRGLQKLGDFDTKTSSWLQTPADIRDLGGAIFGDRRYGRVFVYHNGASSYYGVRGFRGSLRV